LHVRPNKRVWFWKMNGHERTFTLRLKRSARPTA